MVFILLPGWVFSTRNTSELACYFFHAWICSESKACWYQLYKFSSLLLHKSLVIQHANMHWPVFLQKVTRPHCNQTLSIVVWLVMNISKCVKGQTLKCIQFLNNIITVDLIIHSWTCKIITMTSQNGHGMSQGKTRKLRKRGLNFLIEKSYYDEAISYIHDDTKENIS